MKKEMKSTTTEAEKKTKIKYKKDDRNTSFDLGVCVTAVLLPGEQNMTTVRVLSALHLSCIRVLRGRRDGVRDKRIKHVTHIHMYKRDNMIDNDKPYAEF